MLSLLTILIPTLVVSKHCQITPIVPEEAKQGWKMELVELSEPMQQSEKQHLVVVGGQLTIDYGREKPTRYKSGQHATLQEVMIVPEGNVRFVTIDLANSLHATDCAAPEIPPSYFAPQINLGQFSIYGLVEGNETGGEWSVDLLEINSSPKHYHRFLTEQVVVVNGVLDIEIDGQQYLLETGDTMEILPGQVHQLKSASDQPVRVLGFSFPAFDPSDDYPVE